MRKGRTGPLSCIVPSEWKVSQQEFEVVADIGRVLEAHGSGVYTVHIVAMLNEKPLTISEHSIWYGIKAPKGYD